MPTTLQPGDPAPDFELPDDGGGLVRLAELRGEWVVLYWYPKDDTPGCTTEACEIRDNWPAIAREARLFGVSPDAVKSHVKFRAKHSLPFPLLSDADHAVSETYGVWGPKKFMGREYMGADRATFVIAPDGRLAHVWPKVTPAGHAEEIIGKLRELKA